MPKDLITDKRIMEKSFGSLMDGTDAYKTATHLQKKTLARQQMQKNCPVDEYIIPDSTKSLQARAQAAMLQTVSHSFSYSPGKAAGGSFKVEN